MGVMSCGGVGVDELAGRWCCGIRTPGPESVEWVCDWIGYYRFWRIRYPTPRKAKRREDVGYGGIGGRIRREMEETVEERKWRTNADLKKASTHSYHTTPIHFISFFYPSLSHSRSHIDDDLITQSQPQPHLRVGIFSFCIVTLVENLLYIYLVWFDDRFYFTTTYNHLPYRIHRMRNCMYHLCLSMLYLRLPSHLSRKGSD